jgi:2-polyprenyl-6-methoxyphenol hydroxylase-like FAD-dependent oxidoreductase
MRIAVLGGGVGGLSLARALRVRGVKADVRVFEQRKELAHDVVRFVCA